MSEILIAGYGSAGQYLLDFILKDHRINSVSKIHIMSRKTESEVKPRIDISRVAAGLSERFIDIEYHSVDFNNVSMMSEIISKIKPDVIVYTGRYASGLKYGAFSYPNQIGYGVWMPMSFPYIYNLMKAVKMSGIKTKVINTSFPDGVNYLLGELDLAPYTGAGNINHLIPRIKNAASSLFRVRPSDLDVNFVCSHYTNTYVSKEGSSKGSPSLLRIVNKLTGEVYIEDKGTQSSEVDNLKESVLFPLCKDNSAGGQIRNQMIATDCAELVRYLTDPESKGVIHVPGFKGCPGGFRVSALNGMLTRDSHWDEGLTDQVGKKGLLCDGIFVYGEKLYFSERMISRMKEVFNLDYPCCLTVEEIQPFADEIYAKLKEVSNK